VIIVLSSYKIDKAAASIPHWQRVFLSESGNNCQAYPGKMQKNARQNSRLNFRVEKSSVSILSIDGHLFSKWWFC